MEHGPTRALIRIPMTGFDHPLFADAEVVSRTIRWIDAIVARDQLPQLAAAGLVMDVLLDDVDAYSRTVAGDYHSLAEVEQQLQDIASAYPTITELYSIGTSYEDISK